MTPQDHSCDGRRKGSRDLLTRCARTVSKPLVAWSDAVGELWGVPGPLATFGSAAALLTGRLPGRCGRPCADPCCAGRERGHACRCDCCIDDADLVVYARVGEQRIVPISVENPRRREVAVELELSPFASHCGPSHLNVVASISPARATIEPCGVLNVALVVAVRAPEQQTDVSPVQTGAAANAGDVDRCQTLYTDLRVIGCGNRPVRIALAVLPLDCLAYRIECARVGCGCSDA